MNYPFFRNQPEDATQDLLMAYADALVSGSFDRMQLLAQYDKSTVDRAEDLLKLAERISQILTQVTPPEHFVRNLRRDLMDSDVARTYTWWTWVRQLPPSVQWAAGIGGAATLGVAGVVFIARRPVLGALSGWRARRTISA